MLPITIIVGSGTHQHEHAKVLAAGLQRHGIASRIQSKADPTPLGERVACWGWRVGKEFADKGLEVLVMERGYIGDRYKWTSLAWNGLNNRGEFGIVPEDRGERFERHHAHLFHHWDPYGDYNLIIGQVRGDMSLQGRDLTEWYRLQAARWNGQVRFREHPESIRRGHPPQVPPHSRLMSGDLANALHGAKYVVTFNSNTGVESVLAGKPTWVEDEGSMAWDVRCNEDESEPDRWRWASRLAWKQWSLDEIESGLAWEHLRRG